MGCRGSHRGERLEAQGHSAFLVDNYHTDASRNLHLLCELFIEVMCQEEPFSLHVEVRQMGYLACPPSGIHCRNDTVQTTRTSVRRAIKRVPIMVRVRGRW
jgi:hypothetical protein